MSNGQVNGVLRHIRRIAATEQARTLSDRELLERVVGERDKGAFAAIVGRHGGLVWAVCRRILRNRHDAEDAYQATFSFWPGRRTRSGSASRWLVGSTGSPDGRPGNSVPPPVGGAPATWSRPR
jgi:hypothetical protein